MQGVKKILVVLLAVVVTTVAAYSYLSLADPGGVSDASRFVASDRSRIDVTIGVVGISTFIVGFGLRDVIGRWYQRNLRKKAMGHG